VATRHRAIPIHGTKSHTEEEEEMEKEVEKTEEGRKRNGR